MKEFGKYVMVDNINELRKDCSWEDDKNICVIAMGTFHNLDQITYPCFFKYHEPFDNHYCGDYFPCSKNEVIQGIEMQISRLTFKMGKLKNLLDSLKD